MPESETTRKLREIALQIDRALIDLELQHAATMLQTFKTYWKRRREWENEPIDWAQVLLAANSFERALKLAIRDEPRHVIKRHLAQAESHASKVSRQPS